MSFSHLTTQISQPETLTGSETNGRRIGYARVSTVGQTVEAQVLMLRRAGCQTIFKESASGAKVNRPVLAATIEYLKEGDTLVVSRLDRLGRSLAHLISTVQGLAERGVGFESLREDLNTSSSTGRLVFHIFGALAEFERDLISARTLEGLDAARARGSVAGRKPRLTPEQVAEIRDMSTLGRSPTVMAREYGVSRATIYRALA